MEMDPDIRQKQDEWEKDFNSVQYIRLDSRDGPAVMENITKKFDLAAMFVVNIVIIIVIVMVTIHRWLKDAFHARPIDFPRSDTELYYHKVARSRWFRFLFDLTVAIQVLITVFFSTNVCATPLSGNAEILFLLTNLFSIFVYLADLALAFGINSSSKKITRKPFSFLRLVFCILLLVDLFSYTNLKYYRFRVIRSIYPFFFISRRTNMKRMLQATFAAAWKSRPVIIALMSILLLWGFLGFFIFSGLVVPTPRFETPWAGTFTCLHVFTSRPFALISMNPYFEQMQSAPFFFVTLTIAADLICIALIVANSTSEFKTFSARILVGRLKNRKRALERIFYVFAENGR